MRHLIRAILFLVVTGVQWRMLPREYPNWKTVYHFACGAPMARGGASTLAATAASAAR